MLLLKLGFYLDFSILANPREMLQVSNSVNISDIVVSVIVEDGHSTKTYTVSIQHLSSSDTCLMLGHNHSNTKVFFLIIIFSCTGFIWIFLL